MRKILLYTDTPQVGGAELQIYLLAKFLDKSKFTPILACSKSKNLDKWCEKFHRENIKVLRINASHKHDPRHYFTLRKILKTEQINLLHLHIWNPASCRWALFAAKNIPIFTTEHDPFKLPKLKDLIKKILLKKVTKIITVSKNNLQILQKLYPKMAEKIVLIHNGIDTTWWQSQFLRFTENERKQIKANLFLAHENTLIVTCIAELHQRKGIQFIILAMAKINKKFPNTKLVIIGEGKERNKLEALTKKISNQIIFLGRQKEIPKLLKASNIFVLPSIREAFGLVNAEAMISGLPVVATNVGGIPEIVIDGKTGLLVEAENPEAISNALEKLIGNSKLRTQFGEAGKIRIMKHFSAKKMVKEYEKAYQSSLKS